jgi:hypothetical protein
MTGLLTTFLFPPPPAWNPADVSPSAGTVLTFSNNNKTVTQSAAGGAAGVRSVTNKTSGKWYFEILVNTVGSTFIPNAGLAGSSETLQDDWGAMATNGTWVGLTASLYTNGDSTSTGGYQTWGNPGDVLQFAVEVGVGVMTDKNNGGGGTFSAQLAYTVADVKIAVFPGASGPYGPGSIGASAQYTLHTAAADQAYAPPAGYAPWD